MVCNTRPQQASFQNPVFEVYSGSGFYANRFQQPQRIFLGITVLEARVLALVVGQINKQQKAFKDLEFALNIKLNHTSSAIEVHSERMSNRVSSKECIFGLKKKRSSPDAL